MADPVIILATAPQPGAVAILQLHGPGSRGVVQQLTGRARFEDHRLYLVGFADLDEGLAVCRGDDWAQLMPHGGPRVVERIVEWLEQCGVRQGEINNRAIYPEADSPIEADMLAALAMTPSPAAIDLLAAQPALWRHANRQSPIASQKWDHLLVPPAVVVAGPPNAGKSTLANAILGRSVSLVSDLAGSTRDWVGSLAQIQGVAVRWIDTPGIRCIESGDAVEREAVALARQVIETADVLIAMRTPGSEYPPLPRQPDVRVVNQVDDAPPPGDEGELAISALHRKNLDELQRRVRGVLGLADLSPDTLWAFSPLLKRHAAGEAVDLEAYCGSRQ